MFVVKLVFKVFSHFFVALVNTYWPGRSHCIKRKDYTLYLDGAHTPKSIHVSVTTLCPEYNKVTYTN